MEAVIFQGFDDISVARTKVLLAYLSGERPDMSVFAERDHIAVRDAAGAREAFKHAAIEGLWGLVLHREVNGRVVSDKVYVDGWGSVPAFLLGTDVWIEDEETDNDR